MINKVRGVLGGGGECGVVLSGLCLLLVAAAFLLLVLESFWDDFGEDADRFLLGNWGKVEFCVLFSSSLTAINLDPLMLFDSC